MFKRAKGMMLRTQELIGMMLKRAKGMILRTQELIGMMLKRAKGMMLRTQELIGMRDSVRGGGGSKGQLKVWANQALRRPQ